MTCCECEKPVDVCQCPDMEARLYRLIRKGTRWLRLACAAALIERHARKRGLTKLADN